MNFKSAIWKAAVQAAALCEKQGIKCVLVGTAALAVHGVYELHGEDVDFMVDKIPAHERLEVLVADPEYSGDDKWRDGAVADLWLGNKVNFIRNDDEGGEKFFTAVPGVVQGVPVADLKDVLGLKMWADRPKDKDFFRQNPHLAAIVEWGE